jgi:hypothetical protein
MGVVRRRHRGRGRGSGGNRRQASRVKRRKVEPVGPFGGKSPPCPPSLFRQAMSGIAARTICAHYTGWWQQHLWGTLRCPPLWPGWLRSCPTSASPVVLLHLGTDASRSHCSDRQPSPPPTHCKSHSCGGRLSRSAPAAAANPPELVYRVARYDLGTWSVWWRNKEAVH